jgi:predicted polyphosphate/ATP-dependent NAD kinase
MSEGSRWLGLIVNPVAGLGGRVGLKGSDGAEIQRRARALGAEPRAQSRAAEAMRRLGRVPGLRVLAYPGEMGEDAARAAGLEPEVIGSIVPGETAAEDTRRAAREMQARGMDLLLFAGGDGTARDLYEAFHSAALLDSMGLEQPVLGVPAGVKIHSAVYATSPAHAGELAALYLEGRVAGLREAEVMDIDEEAFRQGALSARLYGYLRVPYRASLVQSQKVPTSGEEEAMAEIAADVAARMEPGVLYILAPGTTTRAIARELGVEKTLLGVDVVRVTGEPGSPAELLAADANEAELLRLLEAQGVRNAARIVVTPIGGQGYVFGRGNQQISPRVIQRVGKENVLVVSTPAKLHALGSLPLLVDTGDEAVDEMLTGYVMVVTGYNQRAARKVSS